ncbi:hypothetical protein GCM10023199_32640 [Actinomycetospora chibensis]
MRIIEDSDRLSQSSIIGYIARELRTAFANYEVGEPVPRPSRVFRELQVCLGEYEQDQAGLYEEVNVSFIERKAMIQKRLAWG